MRLEVNKSDLARITGKLKKLQFVAGDLKNPSNPVLQFKVSLLIVYKNAVTRAMGSVQVIDYESTNNSFNKGYHGNVVIDLQGLGVAQTTWKNLSPATVSEKRAAGYRMKIWEATGTAKGAVRIHSEDGFVGLDSSDGEAYDHAVRTEYGGVTSPGETPIWEKRGLFHFANQVVLQQKQQILDRIRTIILSYVGWGK